MAVFLINGCRFKGCSLVFETLAELIQHVEEVHIDIDPLVLEKQEKDKPNSVPLSHILKFYAGAKPRKSLLAVSSKKNRQRNNSVMSTSASIRSLTPTSSEYDFDDDDDDDAALNLENVDNDTEVKGAITAEQQWTNQLILSMVNNKVDDSEKPYACKVKGCKKKYKNINGVKYHARHGHRKEARMAKFTSKCFCGKSFHSVAQLELHTKAEHSLSSLGLSSMMEVQPSNIDSLSTEKEPKAVVSVASVNNKGPLSIIHPITISGGVLLTPTSQHIKAVGKSEILIPQKLSSSGQTLKSTMASLVSPAATTPLVTPPTTPQKKPTLINKIGNKPVSISNTDENQQLINEKVAKALAAAKQAMEAAAAKETLDNHGTPRATIITPP